MAKLAPTNKNNPCLICEDTTGKCRHSNQGLILCMAGAGGHLEGNGYRCIGDSKDGLWGKYLPDDEVSHDRPKPIVTTPRPKNLPKEVGAIERDRRWREYLGKLSLDDADRVDLQRRGRSDGAIDQRMHRSLSNGYLVPVVNQSGLILNCQVRLRDCPSGGRYRWAGHLVGIPNQLRDGQLPIGIYGSGAELWIAEGFLKSDIASERLVKRFMGFGSVAQLTSSRTLIKTTVKELNPDRLVFAPDAGCLLNESVMRQYRSFLRDAQSWGYDIVIAWWGQGYSKDSPDIDELETGAKISYITIDEFLKLTDRFSGGIAYEKARHKLKGSLRRADVVLNLPLLTGFYQLPTDRDVALRSGLGTGKTEVITKLVRNCRSVVALTHRVALGGNLAERLGLSLVNDLDRGGGVIFNSRSGLAANPDRVAACVDSILATPNNPDVLVLDEISKVIRHLLIGGTCKKLRPILLAAFIERVRNARQIILADADLSDFEVNFIEAIRGTRLQVVDNIYRETRSVNFIVSPNETAAIAKGLELVQSGKRVMFLCSQKSTAIQIDALLDMILEPTDRFLIHGDNSGEEDKKLFLSDPNFYLSNYPVKALVASPTIAEGISITGDYFDAVVGVFHASSIDDMTACQFLRRYRPSVETWLWVQETNHKPPRSFTEILNTEAKINRHTFKAVGFGNDRVNYQSEASILSYHYRSDRERALANFRAATRARLEHQGYKLKILEAPTDRDVAEQLKQVKRSQKQAYAEAVSNAPTIDATSAAAIEKLIKYGKATEAERHSLAKFVIENFYDVEANHSLVTTDNKGTLQKRIRRGEDMAKPDRALEADKMTLKTLADMNAEILAGDVPDRYSFATVCEALGLPDLIMDLIDGFEYTGETDRIKEIAQKARECPHIVRTLFGFTPTKMLDQAIVGALLRAVGLKTRSRQQGTGKDRIRIYSLDQDTYAFWRDTLRRRHEKQVNEGFSFKHTGLLNKILEGVCVEPKGYKISIGFSQNCDAESQEKYFDPPMGVMNSSLLHQCHTKIE